MSSKTHPPPLFAFRAGARRPEGGSLIPQKRRSPRNAEGARAALSRSS